MTENIKHTDALLLQTQLVGHEFKKAGFLQKRWVYHTIFWLVYNAFMLTVIFSYKTYDTIYYFEFISLIPLQLIIAYYNLYQLVPRFLLKKKYTAYITALLVSVTLTSVLNILLRGFYFHLDSKYFANSSHFTLYNVGIQLMDNFFVVSLTTSLKFLKNWMFSQQQLKEIEKQYLTAELNFLKLQIQPHFFFNTLNNLYSLTLKKSDEAPEVVLKLSDLMNYMLYESNTAGVPLEKEIMHLQSYLDLERLRFGKRLSFSFNIEGQTEQAIIPPMILIPFIENSFKHGARNSIDQVRIDISIKVKDGYILFDVKNPVPKIKATAESTGIGLKNVKRRLDLLYGSNYVLNLRETENEYVVFLKIPVC